jgi:tripartite-type tricarboxylate transporter receptor subunit TctC
MVRRCIIPSQAERRGLFLAVVLAVVAIAAFAVPARALETAADFYRGKNVTIVIGYPPASGYDVYARALARHIGDHIPGKPTIVPQNMPGAGSLKTANYIYNVAAKDGTTIGAINRSLATAPLLETVPEKKAKLKFDPLKFNWIGSTDKAISLMICRKDSGFDTFDKLKKKQMIATAAAPTSDSVVFPTVFNNLLGTKIKIVSGHQGTGENVLALERGEAQCYGGTTYSSIEALKPQWLKPNDFMNVVVQIATEKDPHLPNVPLIMQYADKEQKKVLDLLLSPQAMGRPYMTTPDAPAARVAALRAAFDATMKDPKFLADAKQTKLSVDPMNGADVEKLLKRIYAADPKTVHMLQQVMPKNG